MGVSITDLIAQGLPGISAINTFLTGVQRREFVKLTYMDAAGVTADLIVELHPTFIGTGKFGVFDIDLLNALNNLDDCSDAELQSVQFISDTTDYTTNPSASAQSSNVKERGKLWFQMETGRQRSIAIPSIRDDLVAPGGRSLLDLTSGFIQNLAAEFTGLGLTTQTFMIDNMNPIGFSGGKRVTYKTHRGNSVT